jgi:hypothetical protein
VNWQSGFPSSGGINSTNPLDSDNDGMPDWWEDSHQLNRNSSADAVLDTDGDGVLNRDEFRARTNPRSAVSRLAIDAVEWNGATASVGFRARAGVNYELESREALGSGNWQTLFAIPADYLNREVVLPDVQTGNVAKFYRLKIP